MAPFQEIALRQRAGAEQRCPYCHDALAEAGVGEEVPCPSCGTLHHEVCLDELGGCTVLGCGGGKARALGSVEEVRARVRRRLERFLEHTRRPRDPQELERVAREGWVCEGCARRLWSLDCPCPGCDQGQAARRPEATPRGRPDLRVPFALSGLAVLGVTIAVLYVLLWAYREAGL